MAMLNMKNEFPKNDYTFYYPDLYLHKPRGDADKYPATIELLCSPYMIISFDSIEAHNPASGETSNLAPHGGYVIYYNQNGSTEYEFMYLLDNLSRFQILRSKSTIKIRVAHHCPDANIKSNFRRAINSYVSAWGYDLHKKNELERIEFDVIQHTLPNYNPGILAWRVDQ